MAVSPDLQQRYPLSTPDGRPIPFDIIRPYGLIKQSFTDTPVNDVVIPEGADFLYIEATEDCYVRIGDDVTAPTNGVHTLGLIVILARTGKVIDHNAAAAFGVVRAGADNGIVYVQTCTKYADIRKAVILERS